MKIARLKSAPELFYSLQGEGASLGTPAIFIRLAGCNLRCTWCDTAYSWGGGMELTTAELVERIRCFPCTQLVITGGEPLLQQEGIAELLRALPDYSVEIETNGTVSPSDFLQQRVTQWNVSPKLPHAGQEGSLNAEILTAFTALPNAWFKFVVQQPTDWQHIASLGLPKHRIILMPCARTRDEIREARLSVAELCIEQGVRFGDRLHLELWDSKKGV